MLQTQVVCFRVNGQTSILHDHQPVQIRLDLTGKMGRDEQRGISLGRHDQLHRLFAKLWVKRGKRLIKQKQFGPAADDEDELKQCPGALAHAA